MNFEYCIWLIPHKNSSLYKLTHGFKPHISIKTHIKTKKKAIQYFKTLSKSKYIIQLLNYKISNTKGFIAFEYSVKFVNKTPEIQPKEPHISFIYSYNTPIPKLQIQHILPKLKQRYVFNKFIIMKCNHHYKTWKRVY